MTSSPDPGQRVGDAERQQAIDLLGQHWQAGRLDPGEHERRTTAAFSAVTRADLDALFSDLPEPRPASTVPGVPAPTAAPAPVPAPAPAPRESWLDGKREAIMGATPFVALILFFTTHTWLWFLAIPLMGAVLYAGQPDRSGDTSRAARRAERRRRRGER